jgi:hypothetical protein
MNISAEKLDIIQKIIAIQDNDLLTLIKSLLTSSPTNQGDWWETITTAERESINRGLADLNSEKISSHEQVRTRYAKWLKD